MTARPLHRWYARLGAVAVSSALAAALLTGCSMSGSDDSLHGVQSTDYGQLLTGTLISVVPVLVLFAFLQRYFVAGLLAGSVKQ